MPTTITQTIFTKLRSNTVRMTIGYGSSDQLETKENERVRNKLIDPPVDFEFRS